jgi:UDP-glucuronate decarboxylase
MVTFVVIEKTKRSASIVYRDLPSGNPRRRHLDISLAERTLGWWPSMGIDEGLGNLIAWYRNQGELT